MLPDANKAILVLKKILEKLGPAYVAYFAAPNTVLTLSGARAFCDGVFWDNGKNSQSDTWLQDINRCLELIIAEVEILYSRSKIQQTSGGEKYAYYELITADGFSNVIESTKLLKNFVRKNTYTGIKDIMRDLIDNLRSQDQFSNYSAQNLNHIAFGILLGYPDKAIVKSVALWQIDDPFEEPLIDADIRGAKYYRCPQPIYSYPRRLFGDPQINKHEHKWSKILRDYYTSGFHKSLEKNQEFNNKIIEIS